MPSAPAAVVRVGVGVMVRDPRTGLVLVGRRKGSHGAGKLAFPGGHLEVGETWDQCARREVLEETGLELRATRHVWTTNDIMEADQKHYITIFMTGELPPGGVPENREPNKCEGWQWISWGELQELSATRPEGLFLSLHNFVQGNDLAATTRMAERWEQLGIAAAALLGGCVLGLVVARRGAILH
mmetsp:Transcript_132483/g.411904  ORF Transcript_132483/g.411904 Transcript_132483/m.411904 type:complete len:185 (-) Transcript_132483:129-683(-)